MKKVVLALALFAGVVMGQDTLTSSVVDKPYQMVGIDNRGQFLSSTPLGAGLVYNTAPILEQLKLMSTSNVVSDPSSAAIVGQHPSTSLLSGAWDNQAIISNQQQVFSDAMFGGAKPVPVSFTQPMIDAAITSQNLPLTAAIGAGASTSFPAAKSVKPIKEFKFTNAPIMNTFETLPVKELPNILQHYSVPSTFTTQENIKQPITQPVWQPYLQRYEQRAVPIVQPVLNRVTQPIIHRQLHPYLTSEVIQGPQQDAIVNAPQVREFKNEPIMGSEIAAQALDDRSVKPNLPVVAAAQAHKK